MNYRITITQRIYKGVHLSLLAQLSRFGGVGCTALVVHWCIVLCLVPVGFRPLIANIIAFFIAFQFSYFGHQYWTFKGSSANYKTQLRFFIVALSGFLLNQSLFWVFLNFTNLSYQVALLLVLFIVAINSFVFSKFWAFSYK